MIDWDWFRSVCLDKAINVDGFQLEKLSRFVDLVRDWNTKINLISRKDEANILHRHILSSVTFLLRFRLNLPCNVVDIGTGGGFPGIPLAILFPSAHVLLLDSIRKKMDAVRNIVSDLRIENVSVVCGRAEEISQRELYHQKYDYIIARAVGSIEDCVRWSRSFLRPSAVLESLLVRPSDPKPLISPSTILLLKGGDLSEEVQRASARLKLKSIEVYSLSVDGLDSNLLPEKKLVLVKP